MPTQLPRVNIIVTEEQHALLSELASLDGRRSAAAIVRELVDGVTPLLRVTVPAMRAAKQELDTNREALKKPLAEMIAAMQQHDLLDETVTPRRSGTAATEGARTAPPKRRRAPRQPGSSHPQGQ